ncbi:hypothetical protein [Selenihalanaerobacter shriftii]|uniref:DUF302 domain-containing protein n=1 Tax=Selenihalanaerobacter shriftii TaxID=142842 RepID=A0A1T4JVV3_9FIRM|nr:hypothetical protein [Selenihalanaerobacter shriftii]SJZ34185.1 hypothetical protein SAMN02745118_00451 [Selenihalanaerobacter shriftii]
MLKSLDRRVILLVMMFTLVALVSNVAAAEDLAMYVKVLETNDDLATATANFEKAMTNSSYKIVGKWDMKSSSKDGFQQKARTYVINAPEYTDLIAKQAPASSMPAAVLKVNVYEAKGKVNINLVNPETTARVFLGEPAEIENKEALVKKAVEVKDNLINIIKGVNGKVAIEKIGPIRDGDDLDGYNGDGMAKAMTKWRNFKESLHANKEIAIDGDAAAAFNKACKELEANIKNNGLNWRLICSIDIGENARFYGITQPGTEVEAIEIDSMSRAKSDKNKFPGIDHAGAFPIPVLVYQDGDIIKVSQFGQMWRMELYFWDAGYGAFTSHMDMPGNIYDDVEKIINGEA